MTFFQAGCEFSEVFHLRYFLWSTADKKMLFSHKKNWWHTKTLYMSLISASRRFNWAIIHLYRMWCLILILIIIMIKCTLHKCCLNRPKNFLTTKILFGTHIFWNISSCSFEWAIWIGKRLRANINLKKICYVPKSFLWYKSPHWHYVD